MTTEPTSKVAGADAPAPVDDVEVEADVDVEADPPDPIEVDVDVVDGLDEVDAPDVVRSEDVDEVESSGTSSPRVPTHAAREIAIAAGKSAFGFGKELNRTR